MTDDLLVGVTPDDLRGLALLFLAALGVGTLLGAAAGVIALFRRQRSRIRGAYPGA